MNFDSTIKSWLEEYGTAKASIAVTTTAVVGSVFLTTVIELLGGGVSEYGFMVATIVPLLIAPPASYFTFRMVERVIVSERELQKALEEIKALSGLIPICATCKNVRDDEGYWHQIESYMSSHSEAQFSHGVCPSCAEEFRKQA